MNKINFFKQYLNFFKPGDLYQGYATFEKPYFSPVMLFVEFNLEKLQLKFLVQDKIVYWPLVESFPPERFYIKVKSKKDIMWSIDTKGIQHD